MLQSESVIARTLADSVIANTPLLNGYIEWETAANALTASIKTKAGADPSASDPVYAVFRNETLGTAGYYVRAITAATTVTASSGSTLGTVSAVASRIRAVLVDDGGTVVLGLYNSWDATNNALLGIDESIVYTTTAEGGAGAADSPHVIYTTAAKTSKAVREAGYVESTQTTAGTWAQPLDKKVTAGVGYYRTGDIVQRVTVRKTDTDSTSSTTFVDFTSGLTKSLTGRSPANLIEFSAYLTSGQNGGGNNFFQLVKGGVPMLVGDAAGSRLQVQASDTPSSVTAITTVALEAAEIINSSASVTYKIQWAVSSGTGRLNFSNTDTNAANFGRSTSLMKLQEIFV
jgi:hypothetical protein